MKRGAAAALKSIVLPERLEALGKHAFKGCKALKKADFPDSFKKIGEGVFAESGLDI